MSWRRRRDFAGRPMGAINSLLASTISTPENAGETDAPTRSPAMEERKTICRPSGGKNNAPPQSSGVNMAVISSSSSCRRLYGSSMAERRVV